MYLSALPPLPKLMGPTRESPQRAKKPIHLPSPPCNQCFSTFHFHFFQKKFTKLKLLFSWTFLKKSTTKCLLHYGGGGTSGLYTSSENIYKPLLRHPIFIIFQKYFTSFSSEYQWISYLSWSYCQNQSSFFGAKNSCHQVPGRLRQRKRGGWIAVWAMPKLTCFLLFCF